MIRRVRMAVAVGIVAMSVPTWSFAQQEIDFAKELASSADGVIVIETHPTDQVLVFKGGTHYLGGRELIIRAPSIRVDADTSIQSFDPSSKPEPVQGTPEQASIGARGGTYGCEIIRPRDYGHIRPPTEYCIPHGGVGDTGEKGLIGRAGARAKPISVFAKTITGAGRLSLVGNGQTGGKGQQGGPGGIGGEGARGRDRGGNDLCVNQPSPTNGGDGGPGGPGGKGGPGGTGGGGAQISFPSKMREIVFVERKSGSNAVEEIKGAKIIVSAPGGLGGERGERGLPGGSGQPGGAGSRSICGDGSDPGGQRVGNTLGGWGDPGTAGPDGEVTFN